MGSKKDAWGIAINGRSARGVHLVRTDGTIREIKEDRFFVESAEDDDEEEKGLRGISESSSFESQITAMAHTAGVQGRVAVSFDSAPCFTRLIRLPPVQKPSEINKIVTYEARQQIPFPLDEVAWGYEVLPVQEGCAEMDVFVIALSLILNTVAAKDSLNIFWLNLDNFTLHSPCISDKLETIQKLSDQYLIPKGSFKKSLHPPQAGPPVAQACGLFLKQVKSWLIRG